MNQQQNSKRTQLATRAGMMKVLLSIGAIIVFSVTGLVYKMTAPRIMTPKELVMNGAIVYEEPRPILPFNLTTQTGQTFTPENIQGQWTLLLFGFTHCPDFCPTTLATLRELVKQLDAELQKNLQVVMVSVDPARDTPQRLQEYFAGFQFPEENTPFIGVTGEFVQIKILADNLYIPIQKQMLPAGEGAHAHHNSHQENEHENTDHSNHAVHTEEDSAVENNYTMIHGENIILISPEGQYYGVFQPPFTVSRLKTTLRSIVTVYND